MLRPAKTLTILHVGQGEIWLGRLDSNEVCVLERRKLFIFQYAQKPKNATSTGR